MPLREASRSAPRTLHDVWKDTAYYREARAAEALWLERADAARCEALAHEPADWSAKYCAVALAAAAHDQEKR